LRAVDGVQGDDSALRLRERAGLEQHGPRDEVLAEVVEVRADRQLVERNLAAAAHGFGEGAGEDGGRAPVRVYVSVQLGLLFAPHGGGRQQDGLGRPAVGRADTTR
jgi:hypothetical protein